MRLWLAFLTLVLMVSSHSFAADSVNPWHDVIDGNSIIIMRHALAPGTGDPDNFELRNCSTQRNLSEQGRLQARAIGKKFKQAGIQDAAVFSSQWCRCLDTATEINIGITQELPFLNSFYERRELEAAQMKDLREWIKSRDSKQPTILVTHQVVISSLTGVYPISGEAVIFKMTDDGKIEVTATIPP